MAIRYINANDLHDKVDYETQNIILDMPCIYANIKPHGQYIGNNEYEKGKADAIEEFLELFCDKNNQSNFITLSHHHHSWNSYAKHVAEQLKEQNK